MNFSRLLRAGASMLAVVMGAILALTVAGTPAVAAPTPRTAAVWIERSGGFAGATERVVVDRTMDNRRAGQVLSLAAGPRFRSLRAEYLPEDPCCDRYRYTVVVRYLDGTVKTVTTVDGAPSAPPVLWDVIRLAMLTGVAPDA